MTRVLIANRGEIACRLVQACHELGYEALAVYTAPDALARHVQVADEAFEIASYLQVNAVIDAARLAHAQAIHPGYGFLSENPALGEACRREGIIFAGPPPEVIRLMGDKLAAKDLARGAGLPLVPGSLDEDPAEIGFPLLIKAAGGGGGKGMRAVLTQADFAESLASAKREARAAFGDDRVFLERLVTHGRHVEIQVFGDTYGAVMHFGERDCSIQRRYQKILEESPAPGLSSDLRDRLQQAAVALARAAHYVGPGTVEFLVEDDSFYFLEMNTRLQVEHGVTELVTGVDLAKLQLKVAFGEPLPILESQWPIPIGHAIEVRIYAEDPDCGFLPAAGVIKRVELPNGPGIRNDVGMQIGDEVGIHFDPLLAKLIVWGADRAEAIARLRDALRRYCVLGVTTNLNFLLSLANNDDFQAGKLTTRFLDDHPLATVIPSDFQQAVHAWQAIRHSPDPFQTSWSTFMNAQVAPDGALLLNGNRYYVHEDQAKMEVWRDGRRQVFAKPRPPSVDQVVRVSRNDGEEALTAPMNGVVVEILVEEGQHVDQHQTLVVLEAMKMEHNIQAPFAGTVKRLYVKAGAQASAGARIVDLAAG